VLLLVFYSRCLVTDIVFYRQPGAQWAIAVESAVGQFFFSHAALEHKRVPLSSMLLALLTGARRPFLPSFARRDLPQPRWCSFPSWEPFFWQSASLMGRVLFYRLRESVTQGLRLGRVGAGCSAGRVDSIGAAR
jgi:hypothetical protein